MKDICEMLGIEKLNAMASHPQWNRVVERFNTEDNDLEYSGTSISVEFCGPIGTLPIALQGKTILLVIWFQLPITHRSSSIVNKIFEAY